ncbi:MAG: Lrp/AsnC family transcriptional regulator [Proteobacteria bacterium]|nr:Lrp/AsnC family transcriptional regulator [Pseudomonadota bacterium]MBS0462824.1 Lrp/AsnC family transcriptional regulator [Pseudomonadota bacterium]MBS0463361.1 Lrp/AsnC family transcriptional regulator [Pseudomonadota bacterium]
MNVFRDPLDRIDLAIVSALQRDGRLSNADLAVQVNLSASACLRRVQRLEADGVIAGYAARVSPAALGLGLQAFVRVQLRDHDAATVQTFVERVAGWDEVVACHALTGDMDYLLHVVVEDLEHFSRFVLDHLLNDAGVADVNSSFVLRTVKRERALPLGHLQRRLPVPRKSGHE